MNGSHQRLTRGLALLVAYVMTLSGCATPGQGPVGAPIAGGPVGCGMQATTQTNNTLTGALIGAGSGVLIGAAAGKGKAKNVAASAAVGALVGGGIGAYMDQQEAALRTELAGSGINMARSGDAIILTLPEGILFAFGQSALSAKAKQGLDRLIGPLTRFEKTTVTVCGHTDSVGSKSANIKLSDDRAHAVSDYLTLRGIAGYRMNHLGFADERPLAENNTATGRAMNRRVEIVLRPSNN